MKINILINRVPLNSVLLFLKKEYKNYIINTSEQMNT